MKYTALLLLIGCGSSIPFAPVRTCEAQGFTIHLQSESLPQCSYYRAMVAAALMADLAFIQESELTTLRAELIYIFANSFVTSGCRVSGNPAGCNTGDTILMSASGSSLVHEWLHKHADITTGDMESNHEQWNTKGAAPGAAVGWENVYYGQVLVGSWLDVANGHFQLDWEAAYDRTQAWMCTPGEWKSPEFDVSSCYLEP